MKKISGIHGCLFCIILAVLIWSGIHPTDRKTWYLEVGPACICLLILIFTYHKFRFTTMSYVIVTILVIFIFIGGHYTYNDVPGFEWLEKHTELKRNHYDRFGHFAKGFLALVLRELLLRRSLLPKGFFLTAVVTSFVLSLAALYEIGEWITAKIMGKSAHEFLGTQGDIWDSEWDMALATLGAIIALCLLVKLQNSILEKLDHKAN